MASDETALALRRPASPVHAAAALEEVFSDEDLIVLILDAIRNLSNLLRIARTCRAMWTAAKATQRSWETVTPRGLIRGRHESLTETGFYFHRHVSVLPCGSLCVPDINNRCLRVLSRDGAPLTTLRHPDMRAPRGPVCVGSVLYAVEAGGGGVHRVALAGCASALHGECHSFRRTDVVDDGWPPTITPDCCASAGGSLYISCSGSDRVLVVDASSLTLIREVGGPRSNATVEFNRPQGLAANDQSLWVCDSGNCRVCTFSNDGRTYHHSIGGYGDAPGKFSEPRGIALLPMAFELLLLVAESRRLQVLTLDGSPLQIFVPDGPAPSSSVPSGPGSPSARRLITGLWGVCVEPEGAACPSLEGRDHGLVAQDGLVAQETSSRRQRVFLVNSVRNECHVLDVKRV